MLIQLLSLLGALLILAAFAGLQFGRTRAEAPAYLWANAVGAGLLAWVAWWERQWGFLLLETVWCAVAVGGLTSSRRSSAGWACPVPCLAVWRAPAAAARLRSRACRCHCRRYRATRFDRANRAASGSALHTRKPALSAAEMPGEVGECAHQRLRAWRQAQRFQREKQACSRDATSFCARWSCCARMYCTQPGIPPSRNREPGMRGAKMGSG